MSNGPLTDLATGAAAGAVIGSAVPGVGTAVGAAAGAVVGGLVGLFSSGPEAQDHSANINGRTINARQVWEQINPGTSSSLHDGAGAAQTLEQAHSARATQIDALNKQMDAAWQGDASQAAQAGGHPLGTWLTDSASNLAKSHTYLTAQGESFDTAKNKVQEIAAKPPESGFLDHINPMSDKDDEINDYNKQGQANVDAFTNYYQASATNAAGMPQYSAWEGNQLSGPGPSQPHVPGGGTGGNGPIGGPGGGGSGNFGGPGSYGLHNPGPQTPIPVTHTPVTPPPSYTGNPPGSGLNNGTTASSYTPPPLTTPSSDYSSGFGPGGSGGFGPGGSGGFGPGGAGAGAGGFGGAVGGFGPGGSGSLSAGASSGVGGGSGSGSGSGSGAGAAGAAAGKAGTSGASGMGRGAGGKGEGSEDEEHQNKYLISEDPNELFGNDTLTAPPVIGE